jgi:uncharacterized protein (DUF1800 family)
VQELFGAGIVSKDDIDFILTLHRLFTQPMEKFSPSAANPWNYTKAAHLLRRAMIGPTEEEIRRAVREGLDKTIDRLFTPFQPNMDLISEWANNEPLVSPFAPDGDEYWRWFWLVTGRRFGLMQWWMRTMIDSPVSLQERMTLFWHGHFVSSFDFVQQAETMYIQHKLFRDSAWGNFKTLTRDITIDPAMLIYLGGKDNFKSSQHEAINENYARELMELFTMGRVNAQGKPNYTQADVRAAARSLTGWTTVHSHTLGDRYEALAAEYFWYRHDDGVKTFLGETGAWNTFDVIDIIFRRRASETALFLCTKLYRTFVSLDTESPTARTIIGELAATFQKEQWEIKPVLEQLLTSAHFFEADNVGCLPKSGADYLLGLMRVLGVTNVIDFEPTPSDKTVAFRFDLSDLPLRMEAMGQRLFFPPDVAGWQGGRTWVSPSALAPRLKFAKNIAQGTTRQRDWEYKTSPIQTFDPVTFAKRLPSPNNAPELVSDAARLFLCQEASLEELAILTNALMEGAPDYEWNINNPAQHPADRIRAMLAAMFSLPKFQLY